MFEYPCVFLVAWTLFDCLDHFWGGASVELQDVLDRVMSPFNEHSLAISSEEKSNTSGMKAVA
jgi:hypothetical protein